MECYSGRDMNPETQNMVRSFDQTEIWYRKIGNRNPKLVLCDGVGCDGFIWKYLIPHFQKRFGIIHWNYRGHGKSHSPSDLDNLGIEACIQDLKILLATSAARCPLVLVGHSMGVQVILEYLHRHPQRVIGLVILCGSAGHAIDHIHDNGLFRKLFPLMRYVSDRLDQMLKDTWRHVLDSELAYLYATTFEINPTKVKREDFEPYLSHLSRMDPIVFLRTLEDASRHTADGYLKDIQIPTLVVAGEKDRFTPFWVVKKLHESLPDSRLLALPEGTHVSPIELPEIVNRRIGEFLDELASRTTPDT